ncbi:MAG TPA: pyruvate dehydrogenase complex dihydrolipoamide acetyltransferase [Rhodoplanes sp.]|nr:pyruvate dehydrogenase complex dihydrolipoamide acetyltransferase [Rhodoplanes sp.]
MPINILMPALSPTMEKGNLAKWLKKEGDKVRSGDIIAEIETDKATMEYEAVDEGTLARILVAEGTHDVPVNQPIAVLAVEGEVVTATAEAAQKATPAGSPSPGAPSGAPASPQRGEAGASRGAVSENEGAASRPARSTSPPGGEVGARSAPGEGARASGQGTQPGAVMKAGLHDGGPAPANTNGGGARPGDGGRRPASGDGGGRIFSSPLARRLAREAGIELSGLEGSGPHGRIVARDIEQAKQGRGQRAPSAAPAAPAAAPPPVLAPSDEAVRALYEPGSYEFAPHDQMRRIIAQRLVLAKQTIPHFYLTVTCTIDGLLRAREEINAAAPKDKDGKPAWKLSVNDFVIKALALALMRVPEANVTWTEAGMLKHKHADVGVAVAIPGGLITPIVRQADTKGLSAISAEMKDFAARARTRRLKPEEYQGGATVVSNLGMYGIEEFAAVINPPHATILAVGAGEERAVVRSGKIEVATQMKATLSTDHRAVDGALGAELISAFKALIEHPVLMVV